MATRNKRRQVALAFDERFDRRSPQYRGGKGASLVDMRALGLPVPPGFTLTPSVSRAFMEHGMLPKRATFHIEREINMLERKTGKKFGDPKNPLLLSVRSGAEVSMPGMMDTILNLGINDEVARALEVSCGKEFVRDIWKRFGVMYRQATGEDSAPNDPREQLYGAIHAVLKSWNSERAVEYRKVQGIANDMGTAVTIQQMVFGNKNECSGTGVVFSRNPNTGEKGMFGEFLPGAQGEDVVSGSHTPLPIGKFGAWNTGLYQELERYVHQLENHLDAIADVEFTVEDGKLWLLQYRAAKLSTEAAVTFAVHQVWDKKWKVEKALKVLPEEQIDNLNVLSAIAVDVDELNLSPQAVGIPASPGAAVGRIALTPQEAIAIKARGEQVVLLRQETSPDDLPGMLAASAIVTLAGGATSHAAVVARQLNIPAVVGTGTDWPIRHMQSGEILTVCGNTGKVFLGELELTARANKKEVNIFLRWHSNNMPAPRIDFEAAKLSLSAHQFLADVYLLDAMEHAAAGSALASKIRKKKCETLVRVAERFACYLAIAVFSELRHAWGRQDVGQSAELREVERIFGVDGSHERGDTKILEILRGRPVAQQAAFFKLAAAVLGHSSFGTLKTIGYAGIGGPRWAAIAEAGYSFLSGEWTHGLFVDRVFDLRHNGGRLFDKHAMFSRHTRESELHEQLDFKRSCTSIGKLFSYFILFLTEEVIVLWGEGRKLNLWKEERYEQATRSSPYPWRDATLEGVHPNDPFVEL